MLPCSCRLLTKSAEFLTDFLLGIDDSKMEQEQAVKFVRVASTRGIDGAADVVVLPTSEEGNADLLVLPPFR